MRRPPNLAADQALIDRFIAEKGVTRCPPATANVITQAQISPEDSAALEAHTRSRENAWRAKPGAGWARYWASRKKKAI